MLSLRELRYFAAVAETLHFGRAADKLQIAQPALSRSIMGLEAKLGVTLFERSSREVRLTEAGAELLLDAEAVLHAGEAMVDHAHELGSAHVGELNLGFLAAIEETASNLIERFNYEHPGVVVNHRREYQSRLVEAIRSRELATAILMADPQLEEEFAMDPFVEVPMFASVGPGHPLAGRDSVPLAELAGFPFSDFVSYPGLLPRVLAAALEAASVEPRWIVVSTPVGRGPGARAADDDETIWLQTTELRQPDSPMRRVMIDPPGLPCPFAIVSRQGNDSGILKLFQSMARDFTAEVCASLDAS